MMNYEEQVCGILMYEPAKYAYCVDVGLKPEHFLDLGFRNLYSAIAEIAFDDDADKKMTKHLWEKCPENIQIILNSFNVIHNRLTIESSCQGVFDNLSRQNLILTLSRGIERAKLATTESEIEKAKTDSIELLSKDSIILKDRYSNKEYRDVLLATEDKLDANMENARSGRQIAISTGFKKIDKSLGGFLPGGLYILAARTGMGKTTLAINFAENVLKQDYGVLFFSNEMDATQIAIKHLSLVSKVKSYAMDSGVLSENEKNRIHSAIKSRFDSSFIINEFAGTQFEKFKMQLRLAVKKYNVKVVFHDYIQQMFMEGRHSNRVQELSRISSEIKNMAREFGVSIVCLAQLNRQAESNTGDVPNLSHIKDSGAMEQDADVVMLIHRKRDSEDEGTEIIVAKNRFNYVTGGNNGHIILNSDLSINRFYEEENLYGK